MPWSKRSNKYRIAIRLIKINLVNATFLTVLCFILLIVYHS